MPDAGPRKIALTDITRVDRLKDERDVSIVTELRLRDCIEGSFGLISHVQCQSATSARLLEMGMIPGEMVRVIRAGSPSILQVGESRLCVRPADLEGITLSPIDSSFIGGAPVSDMEDVPDLATANSQS